MYNAGPNQPFSASITNNNVSLSNPQQQLSNGAAPPVTIPVGNLTGLNQNNYKLPVVYQYSVGVQRAITARSVLNVSYVGNQQRHQNDYQEIDLPNASLLPGLVANSSTYNQVVPYLGYHSIRLSQDESNGHYNSLQASLSGQMTRDLQLNFGYTLSKAMGAAVSQAAVRTLTMSRIPTLAGGTTSVGRRSTAPTSHLSTSYTTSRCSGALRTTWSGLLPVAGRYRESYR